jgi:polysaccharide pyruvyl transferase WcaK-like protein
MGTPTRCSNRGVEALGAALVDLCLEAAPQADVAMLLGNRDSLPVSFRIKGERREVQVVHARRSPWTHPRHFLPVIVFMSALHRLAPTGGLKSAIEERVPWIKAVAQADFVGDIRGGDSFSDIYGLRRFLSGFVLAWTVILIRGKIVQLPQTYGPYRKPLARLLARYLLKRSTVIIARDKASQKIARDFVGPGREVLLSPDVAFALETVRPACIDLEPAVRDKIVPITPPLTVDVSTSLGSSDAPLLAAAARPSSSCHVIGLNINGLMYFGGYSRKNMFGLKLDYPVFLRELITALLQEHDGELWIIPHTYGVPGSVESDPDASRRLRDQLAAAQRSRVRLVTREYDCHELKGVIGECSFVIGSRMHACIAALSQGIPCVGIAYSMKFRGVFETVGMQDWVVDGRTATDRAAVARVLELYRRRDEVRTTLAERADAARVELRAVFRRLMAGCASS